MSCTLSLQAAANFANVLETPSNSEQHSPHTKPRAVSRSSACTFVCVCACMVAAMFELGGSILSPLEGTAWMAWVWWALGVQVRRRFLKKYRMAKSLAGWPHKALVLPPLQGPEAEPPPMMKLAAASLI